MTLKKVSDYVTCGELIDRLGCLTIEFVKGIRRGIVPKPTNEAGDARTAETDPAFYDHSLMPSVDEWVKYVRAAKIHRFFAESSWPRMVHELGHCWEVVEAATTPPTSTTEPGQDQKVEAVPHFATASDLVAYYRGREVDGRKIHELHELARLVDEEFTRKARLTDEELGMLLPAKGKEAESPEGCRSQGKRLRSLYKKSQ